MTSDCDLGTFHFHRFHHLCTLQTIFLAGSFLRGQVSQEHFHASSSDRDTQAEVCREILLCPHTSVCLSMATAYKTTSPAPQGPGHLFPSCFREPQGTLALAAAARRLGPCQSVLTSVVIYMYPQVEQPGSMRPGNIPCSELSLESRPWCHVLVSLMINRDNRFSSSASEACWGSGSSRSSSLGVTLGLGSPSQPGQEARPQGQIPHGG